MLLPAAYRAIAIFKGGGAVQQWREWLLVQVIVVITVAVVHGLVVRRAGRRSGLALAILGFLSLALFSFGLPAVLATGALALATNERHPDGSHPTLTGMTLGLGASVLVLGLGLALGA